ncbi:MAG TPA: hypothetical protein DEP60_08245 [Ruminococcaceae bacterium]|nr:hypothetical protein [Oscillospiraceae bacterium]
MSHLGAGSQKRVGLHAACVNGGRVLIEGPNAGGTADFYTKNSPRMGNEIPVRGFLLMKEEL